jgi:hypothetical protein
MRGNRSRILVVTGALILLVVAALPSVAQGKGSVSVTGGGMAAFDQDPNLIGGFTTFAFGVQIHADGSANGKFECLINGVLSLSVKITSGCVTGGIATISGPAIVHFSGGGTFEFVATITATAGGPGVGTFCLSPDSYGNPFPACDHEVVAVGEIKIH